MKKTGDASSFPSGRKGIDTTAEQDLNTFLSILTELSGMLRELGYADEGRMLMVVKRDMQRRLQSALPLVN